MKKRVLHFYGEGSIGGKEKAQIELLRSFLNDQDYEFGVAILRDRGPLIEDIRKLGIPTLVLNLKNGFDFNFKKELLTEFRKYDIHHLHDPSPNTIIYSLLGGNEIKRVFTRRGGISECKTLKQIVKFHFKKILIKSFFDGFSGNSTNAVKSVVEQYKISNHNVFLLHNSVPIENLKPSIPRESVLSLLGLQKDDFIIGGSGKFIDLKRFEILLVAISLIKDFPLKLILLGDGKNKFKYYEIIHKHQLTDKVIFPGYIKDIANYLQIMDCFVMPSDNRESFGNSLVEAMYFKIPSIIMNDSSGLKDHIIDQSTGYVVSDVKELSERIKLIKADQSKAQEVGLQAHKYVLSKYSTENLINNYKCFYNSLFA